MALIQLTITRRVGTNAPDGDRSPPDTDQSAPGGEASLPGAGETVLAADTYAAEPITPSQIERVTDLARDFARAAHQIGRLEAEKENLQSENARLALELAEARKLLTGSSQELDDLRRRLADEAQARAALLEAQQKRTLTWWDRFLGRS